MPNDTFTCDLCHVGVNAGTVMHGCDMCNWDLCDSCFEEIRSTGGPVSAAHIFHTLPCVSCHQTKARIEELVASVLCTGLLTHCRHQMSESRTTSGKNEGATTRRKAQLKSLDSFKVPTVSINRGKKHWSRASQATLSHVQSLRRLDRESLGKKDSGCMRRMFSKKPRPAWLCDQTKRTCTNKVYAAGS